MKNPRGESWAVSYSTGFTLTICIGHNPGDFFQNGKVISIPSLPDILSSENSLFPVISFNTSAFISQPNASHKFSEQVY